MLKDTHDIKPGMDMVVLVHKLGEKNFLQKFIGCRDEPVKRMETRLTQKHKKTIPLRKYGGKEKDTKTTLHLLFFFWGRLCTELCKLTAMILMVFFEYNPIS